MSAHRPTGSLRLVSGKRGDVWYARLRRDGKQTDKRIGPAWTKRGRCPDGHLTEAAANAKLHEMLTAPDARPEQAARTFRQACDAYLLHREHEKACEASTLRDYRLAIDRVLIADLGADTPVAAITEDDVREVRAGLMARVASKTARKYMTILYGIFEVARRAKWIAVNPAADVERVPVKRASGRFRALEPEQVMAVVAAAAELGGEDRQRAEAIIGEVTAMGDLGARDAARLHRARQRVAVPAAQDAQLATRREPTQGRRSAAPQRAPARRRICPCSQPYPRRAIVNRTGTRA